MTKPSHGSSLLQARHSHSHSFFHRFRHNPLYAHKHQQQDLRAKDDDKSDVDDSGSEKDLGANASVELDSPDGALAKRNPSAITEKVVVNAVDGPNSFVTHVVQTISLVQYVDPWGSAFETKTVYAPPNTVVVDPKTGKTVAISVGGQSVTVLPGSTPDGSGLASSSHGTTISTSLGPKLTPVPSAATAKPAYPSVGDIRNSTNTVVHGNSTFVVPTNSSSLYKPLLFSAPPSSISTTELPTTSEAKPTSKSSRSTHRTSSFSITATTSPGSDYSTLTVVGSLPTTQPESGSSGGAVNLTPQQKQVIGGVVGAVAGVAVIGFLLMIFLRYKKRKGGRTILDADSAAAASRSLGDGPSGPSGGSNSSGGAMVERSAASGPVAAAFANLTGKRPPPTSHSAESGERGFYRVSGRKLPSVLYTGGDGYSDPRGSATSGSSDYYRGSQAFEPASTSGQLALGAPMRPVSGVPIIRSGPGRVAITENPFADPEPPSTPNNLSTRTLGSRESPRASGSRFQEGI